MSEHRPGHGLVGRRSVPPARDRCCAVKHFIGSWLHNHRSPSRRQYPSGHGTERIMKSTFLSLALAARAAVRLSQPSPTRSWRNIGETSAAS